MLYLTFLYKIPGLNSSGTDIADDLTYGTGSPQSKLIYNGGQVSKDIDEYKKVVLMKKNMPCLPIEKIYIK